MKLKLIQDLGAYRQLLTPAIPTLSVLMCLACIAFRTSRAEMVGVFTNCMPTDAYRGAGRPEATHGIERMVDILAAELKMDPVEIRLKNFVHADEFPSPLPPGSPTTPAITKNPSARRSPPWTTPSYAPSR